MYRYSPKGFTLVELVVVITVIAIVSGVSIISYVQIQAQSRDDRRSAQLTILIKELEKFYYAKGEYPPGCPDTTCPNAMHTTNLSSAVLTSNATLTTLKTVLPGIGDRFGDPQSTNLTLPFKNRTVSERKYYYFGGTVNYTAVTATLDSASHTNFPCTIRSTLAPGQVGSYVVGYFEETTSTWVLKGGRDGVPMTVFAGSCVIVRA